MKNIDKLKGLLSLRITKICLGTVFVWQILLELTNYFVPRIMPIKPFHPPYLEYANGIVSNTPFGLGRWAHWDGYHYLGIVMHGYFTGQPGISPATAFFPAFPYFVRLIKATLHINPIIAGLGMNFVLSIGLAFGIYRLAALMSVRYSNKNSEAETEKIALFSVVLLFIYPASLFLAAFYSDALLAAAVTWCLYCLLNEKYVLAALLASISCADKISAIVLIPAALLIIAENKQWKITSLGQSIKSILPGTALLALGCFMGLGSYMIYLWHKFGDPLLFYKAEALWGRGQDHTFFLKRLWEVYYRHLLQPHYYGFPYQYISMIIVQALPPLVIILTLWYGKKYKAYWVPAMSILLIFLPLVSGVMESLNRYMLMLSPLFISFATFIVNKRVNRYVLGAGVAISIELLIFFAGGFLNGHYFAG